MYIFGISCYNNYVMNIREPCLPVGWYPGEKNKIEEFLKPFSSNGGSSAAIAPHAGWFFSGSLAAQAVSSLDSKADTVAVIGGHLPKNMPILIAKEDGVKTNYGSMKIDRELRMEFEKQLLEKKQSPQSDRYNDNTVEVLLPMVNYFFPRSELLWLRFPANISSFDAGIILYESALALGRHLVVLASVDLTHYGDNYGITHKGTGKAALDWVKNVNDALLIKAILSGDPALILKLAEDDRSSCSAGAILGALGFVKNNGKQAKLLEYSTSADINGDLSPSSFVGYAAISFQ